MKGLAIGISVAILALATACGQTEKTGRDAEPALISGTGLHKVTGTDVRVRDYSLNNVIFVVTRGDEFYPTGASKTSTVSGIRYMFFEAYFTRFDSYGWIADAQWVQPSGGSAGPVYNEIEYAQPGSVWTIITREDAGMGLNCRQGPGTNHPITITIRHGEAVWSNGIHVSGGKHWMSVRYTGPSGWDYQCYVRATWDRLFGG